MATLTATATEQPAPASAVQAWAVVLALVFLTSFILYYFVNWKYLSTVWPLS